MKKTEIVRPFKNADIAAVAALYERVNGLPENTSSEALYGQLHRVFVENPWRDDSIPSLVTEQADGKITGCLGVVPRPMMLNGEQFHTATSHSFAVDPEARSGLSALEMVRVFLNGPQQLSMCQGDEISGRIWNLYGGAFSQIYSLGWIKPLRPASYVLSALKRRGMPQMLTLPAAPMCRLADRLAPRLSGRAFTFGKTELNSQELDSERILELLPRVASLRKLRPVYDAQTLQWLFETMAFNPNRGALRKRMLVDGDGIVGWYVYYLRGGVIAEVAQIAADNNLLETVLQHLFWEAREDGAVAVIGQVEPALLDLLCKHSCILNKPSPNGLLLHSSNREVRDIINDGQAFLSRMESEWWISELLR